MAEVTLSIGGRHYNVHCGDGEETHITRLAGMIDDKTAIARKASPGLTEVRQLLFAAILLADEAYDLRAQTKGGQRTLELDASNGNNEAEMVAMRLNSLAARIESLSEALAGSTVAP